MGPTRAKAVGVLISIQSSYPLYSMLIYFFALVEADVWFVVVAECALKERSSAIRFWPSLAKFLLK